MRHSKTMMVMGRGCCCRAGFRGTVKWYALVMAVLGFVSASCCSASDMYLLNCGGEKSTTVDSRDWTRDSSAENVTFAPAGVAAATAASGVRKAGVPYPDVYRTCRIFDSEANYSFRINNLGRHWVRLHFYPFTFRNYDPGSSALFSVRIGALNLVSDLNVSAEISAQNALPRSSGVRHVMKEFSIYTDSSDLVLTLTPADSCHYAFISAIEVISTENNIFPDSVNAMGSSSKKITSLLDYRPIQTMLRLNVGGKPIPAERDLLLTRTWEEDEYYMYTAAAGDVISNKSELRYGPGDDASVAPMEIYETARVMTIDNQVIDRKFNVSWVLPVHAEFEYLIRFHFCELQYTKPNQRVFRIYINNRTAAYGFDVISLAGGAYTAMHSDYLTTTLPAEVHTIWVQIGTDPTAAAVTSYADAILNGLEVFKLGGPHGLAGAEDDSAAHGSRSSKITVSLILWPCLGLAAAALLVGTLLLWFLCRPRRRRADKEKQKQKAKQRENEKEKQSSCESKSAATAAAALNLRKASSAWRGRRFTAAELRTATNDFDEARLIGEGRFGKVYKVQLEGGVLAAVKRHPPRDSEAEAEADSPVMPAAEDLQMLLRLRHRHVVALLGFCDEDGEAMLVYEYMPHGTLRGRMGSATAAVPWRHRLEMCVGAARGLHYLHTGADAYGLVHGDVTSNNILLDGAMVAKVSDFGLRRRRGSGEDGEEGAVSDKADVYALGAVLMEAVCAGTGVAAETAGERHRKGLLHQVMDPRLCGSYTPASLSKVGDVAVRCLADDASSRPSMGDLLWNLEYALQLHDAALRNEPPPLPLPQQQQTQPGDDQSGPDHPQGQKNSSSAATPESEPAADVSGAAAVILAVTEEST